MANGIKSGIVKQLERVKIAQVLLMGRGYLKDSGWVRSAVGGSPVDVEGRPRPWLSLPAVRFLEQRLPTDVRVFEWGSGSSTRWWAARVAAVRSCEHDAAWFDKVRRDLPANAEVVRAELGPAYLAAYDDPQPWDVVLVDGRDRVACARHALSGLSDRGVVVFDDADRERYQEGLAWYAEQGFSRVDFYGPKLCSRHEHTTSVLYRSGHNVLGL